MVVLVHLHKRIWKAHTSAPKYKLLSVTGFEPSIFSTFDRHHETMLLAPFITFVIQIPFSYQKTENFTIQKIWWACYFCQVERELYVKMQIFRGTFNRLIQESHATINEFHRINPAVLKSPEILGRPLLNAILTDRNPKLHLMYPSICLINKGILPHINYGKITSQRGECLEPTVLSLEVLAEKLNMTVTFGGLIATNEISLHNQVSISVFLLIPSMVKFLNPVLSEIFLLDNTKTGFRYCEPKTNPVYISIFAILGQPFDQITWICVVGSMIGIFYYFYWKTGLIVG